jgi:hypothetical protein
MEVFTVGDACASTSWRETTADPPYPVAEFVTAVFANGALFWVIEKRGLEPSPHGLLRLRLDDESFSVTRLPHSLDDPDALDGSFILDEMHGELCLTAFSSSSKPSELMQPLKIWTLVVEEDGSTSTSTLTSRWEHRSSPGRRHHGTGVAAPLPLRSADASATDPVRAGSPQIQRHHTVCWCREGNILLQCCTAH